MSALSNWREEFNLSEVVTGKMTDKEALKKVSEKDNINNKVTINPKLDEAVKEIGGEVISMVEQDTTAQKQRIDMKQMILDRQKLKLRRKDLSAAKKEKKEGEEGEATNAMKQANVIAQEETVVKKENEKKRKNALLIQKVIGEGGVLTAIGRGKKREERKPQKAMDAGARVRRAMKRREHAKYVSGSEDNVPDDIREGDVHSGQGEKIQKRTKAWMDKKGQKGAPGLDAMKARTAEHKAKRGVKEDWKPEIEHSKLGDAKKKADKKRESKLPPHLQGDAIGKMKKAFATEEDKAFNFVLDKIRKEVGKDGYVSKNNPRKPQSDADKAKARAHQAKVDKENAAERAKDPSQGRYPRG